MQYGLTNYTDLITEIGQDRDIRYVLPRINFSGLISNGDKSIIFMGTGVDPVGEFRVKGPFLTMVAGSVLSRRETTEDPKVVIGEKMAASLGVAPGDYLTLMTTTVEGSLNAFDVTVQGVMTTGVPERDRYALYVNISTAQELMQTNKVSTLSIYLRNTSDTKAYMHKLQTQYPELAWQTWLDTASYYRAVKGLYNRIFGLLGLIILVMVFFSISNTVSMSVIERTREIGTLRAIGAYPREINRGLALEGLVIGLVGSFIGLLLGWVFSYLLYFTNWQMPPPPGRSEGYPLAIDIPPALYIGATVLSILICILAAWLAARQASSKPIVEALSHV